MSKATDSKSTTEPLPTPLDAPPSYSASTPNAINVLLVGESQHGKSTLIKALHSYARNSEDGEIPGLIIGNGNVAATRTVGRYPLTITPRSYKLIDPYTEDDIKNKTWDQLYNLLSDEAQVVPVEGEVTAPVEFNFIDTPGMNDSEGADMDLMAGIIGSLANFSTINAVIYVRNTQVPFGKSFKEFFNYLHRSMPTLANGLIVVHTHFSVEYRRSRGENVAKLRSEAFRAASGMETAHFFMDNVVDETIPLAVLESKNEMASLLNHLKQQHAFPVSGLCLLKTDAMRNVDAFVLAELRRLVNLYERKIGEHSSKLRDSERAMLDSQREIMRLERRKQRLVDDLEHLTSGGEIILATKAFIEEYKIVNHLIMNAQIDLGGKRVEYDANCIISSVEKTVSGGSRWLSEELLGTSWRAVITAGYFRSIRGSATFYTTAASKNAREIRTLRENIADLQDQIAFHTIQRDRFGTSADGVGAELSGKLEDAKELIARISKDDCDMNVYPGLRRFYAIKGSVGKNAVNEFVRIYSEGVASGLAEMEF